MGHEDDPDREAILTRRRQLVAVALSGLTSLAACGGDPAPSPCLSPMEVRATESEETDRDDGRDDGPSVPEDEASPQPCLAPPPSDDPVDDDPADEDDPPRPRPVPCLSPVPPRR